ncbi:MAG: helix-hairpin-helix domain-containing protein [Ignavibacteriae bacterium]|nr:MAG: helix-hairpin-helix domain-containing protein [Ignavibacteriota bacterium]
MLKRFADWMALTKTERKVILFLTATLLAGAGIRLVQATFPSAPNFDYHASDSTFAALSAAPDDRSAGTEGIEEPSGKLNINTATRQQLLDLPGIGEVTAKRILEYRAATGKFISVDDLRAVKGMSGKKIETLRPLVIAQ